MSKGIRKAGVTSNGDPCKCSCHIYPGVMHIAACCSIPCVFCQIVRGKAPATIVYEDSDAIAIVPLNPVTDGHLLVIPKIHLRDASHDPVWTAIVAGTAARIATGSYNLIVNCGEEASQTVFHLHWHIVPRRKDDGLLLPWTNQQA